MKRFLMGVMAVSLCAATLRAYEPKIPSRFLFKFTGTPLWVSASNAVMADGKLRRDVLRREDWEELDRRERRQDAQRNAGNASAQSDCDVAFFGYVTESDDYVSVSDARQLRDAAATRDVVHGVIAASAVGIHSGMPFTVLRIDRPAAPPVYLLHPTGRMRFDVTTVCNDDPSYAATPAIGDEIVFVATPPVDESGRLYKVPGEWIYYEHRGAVVVPPALRSDPDSAKFRSVREVLTFLGK